MYLRIPAVLALCACEGTSRSQAAVPVGPAAPATVSACQKLEILRGGIGGGQSGRALATRDQAPGEVVWDKHVAFDPGTEAVCSFPANEGARGLSLRFHYRGPAKSETRWTFEVWEFSPGRWVYLGDNGLATTGRWTAGELPLPGPTPRFVSQNQVRVRYRATGLGPISRLDQWVLAATAIPPAPDAAPR